ncbi:hypothetical protein CRUP_026350, partial [Coryphaenoides rupestris]
EEEEEEEEAQHDSSDQGDEDDDDEGSVEGEHDTDDDDDDDGDGDDDGGEEDDHNDADGGGEADKEDEQGGGGDGDEEQGANPNAGWADAMSKILKKNTPASKPSILVKSKQLEKIRTDKKRAWEMMCRVKPDIATDREAERTFQRTATRGVVQLFNAVRKHQNLVNDKVKEVGGSERKKAKLLSSVTKKDFIDVLRGKNMAGGKVVKAEKRTAAADEDEKPSWSVLRDDFMMGAKMKDWDKQSDTEGEQAGAQNGGAEDSDSD